jgi:Arc/MetJ-type ribon-helix-helix transcriptional regulator
MMTLLHLPDELQRVIHREVAEGRAASAAAFLEEAVMRLVEDNATEDADIRAAVAAGDADVEAGRYRTIATASDERRLIDEVMARVRAGQSDGG